MIDSLEHGIAHPPEGRVPQVPLLFAVPTCGVVGEPDRGKSQGLLELVLPNRTLRKDALRKSHFFLLSRRAVWSESQTGERVRDSWNSSFPDRDASGHLKPAARPVWRAVDFDPVSQVPSGLRRRNPRIWRIWPGVSSGSTPIASKGRAERPKGDLARRFRGEGSPHSFSEAKGC